MNTNRRGLLLSGRRSCQAAALALGALALGGVCAPAALAMQGATDAAVPATPAEAGAPRILTGSPVLGLGSPEDRVQFGVGKAQLAIQADGSNLPAGIDPDELDLSGATIRFTYETVAGGPPDEVFGEDVPESQICTTDVEGVCVFPVPEGEDPEDGDYSQVGLFPGSTFTIEQLTAPTSGQLLLPENGDQIVYGETDGVGLPSSIATGVDPFDPSSLDGAADGIDLTVDAPSNVAPEVEEEEPDGPFVDSSVTFQDPGAYRTIAVTTSTPAGAPVAGATYTLCTVPDAACTDPAQLVSATTDAQGRLVFPGLYLPGTYTITQTTTASGLQFSGTPVSFTVTAAQSVADTQAALVLPVVNAAPAAPVPTGPTLTPVVAAGPQLARTGTDTVPMALAGAGLLAVGAGAVAAGRRRSRTN